MSASGTLRQAGRAGRARPRARRALHARRHWLALGKGGGAGSRIPSAIAPPSHEAHHRRNQHRALQCFVPPKKSSPKRVQPESNREPSKWMQVIQVRAAENLAMTRENDRSRRWHKGTLVALLIRGSGVRIPPGALLFVQVRTHFRPADSCDSVSACSICAADSAARVLRVLSSGF